MGLQPVPPRPLRPLPPDYDIGPRLLHPERHRDQIDSVLDLLAARARHRGSRFAWRRRRALKAAAQRTVVLEILTGYRDGWIYSDGSTVLIEPYEPPRKPPTWSVG